VLHPRIWL